MIGAELQCSPGGLMSAAAYWKMLMFSRLRGSYEHYPLSMSATCHDDLCNTNVHSGVHAQVYVCLFVLQWGSCATTGPYQHLLGM